MALKRNIRAQVARSLVAAPLFLLASDPVAGQMPSVATFRALHLDSLPGEVPMYFSSGITSREVSELQQLMQGCIARYRSLIPALPSVAVAILDSTAWRQASGAPYGFPHQNPTTAPVAIVVPTTAAPVLAEGIPAEQADRQFHLLALHELGHVLMFAAVGVDRTSLPLGTPLPVPGWFLEFAADFLRLPCLAPADAALGVSPDELAANRPTYTSLDDGEVLYQKPGPDGKPYVGTPAFLRNIAWYHRILEYGARLQLGHEDAAGFLGRLREQWRRPSGSADTQVFVKELDNPALSAWLTHVGAIP